MTKTYDDIEAVTRLLEEVSNEIPPQIPSQTKISVRVYRWLWKVTYWDNVFFFFVVLQKEKDLELTARIGKELLQTNNKLENTVASLETDLKAAHEKLTQLSHEVLKKTELIQILTNDVDESNWEVGLPGRINLDLMQKRIGE